QPSGLPLGLRGELSRRRPQGRFNPHPYRTPLNPLQRRCDPTRVQRRLRHRRQSYPSRSLLPRSRQKRRAARTGATEAGTTPLRRANSTRITRTGAATATNDQVRAGDQSSRILLVGAVASKCASKCNGAACLEPISKSFEEDNEAGKLDKAEEIVGVVLPTN